MAVGFKKHALKQRELIICSLKLQTVALFFITVIIALIFNIQALAVIMGGMCAIVPNLYFAYYSFRYKGANQAKKVLGSIFFAEAIKFILVVCMLTISYKAKILDPKGILAGFVGVFASIILLPLVCKEKNSK